MKLFLNPNILIVTPVIAMLVICITGYLVRVIARTRHLPVCWNCGAAKVRRSLPQNFFDYLGMLFFLNPYRCKGCRVRFYGLRTHRRVVEHATNGSVWWGT